MHFRVRVAHVFRDNRGRPLPKQPGDYVNVSNKNVADALLKQGKIEIVSLRSSVGVLKNAGPFSTAFRVGCFMHTSRFYSGGRIHMYQFAWTLANMGAEVFLTTDNTPIWKNDYPATKNLHIITGSTPKKLPGDLEVLITDGKAAAGMHAVEYKRAHPNSLLVCLNFETPNWMAKFDPSIAAKMPKLEEIYKNADIILSNSEESRKHLLEYMTVKCQTGILPPAANTYAISKNQNPLTKEDLKTPYVVWSARGSAYKGCSTAINCVKNYKHPLNAVLIGKPTNIPKNTDLHKFISFKTPITDAQKMSVMQDAACIIAPSLFEGFGMVPSESFCNGTPVVAYDLPVLRQEYGNRIVYAKHGNADDFCKKVYETIEGSVKVNKKDAENKYGMKSMETNIVKIPQLNFKKRRVSAQMICYYGETVQESIASVYDHCDEVIIAHGPTKLWKDVPGDNSLELIKSFPDPENKIKLIEKDVWANKGEMRKACQRYMTGNHLLIVDADEIYHNLGDWVKHAPSFGCPRWVHFWHDLEHYVVDASGDSRWGRQHPLGGGSHNHLRWAHWRRTNKWSSSKGTVASDIDDNPLSSRKSTSEAVKACPQTCIYHLGHVLNPALMKAKHEFYLKRDGTGPGRVKRMEAWHNWNGKLGDQGDGLIKKVDWEIPELVKQAFARIECKDGK
ncbi:glycosyltransferase [Candidatus Pacearchaeota archaeon]|nr:glycosyltransferase [Candidatus Pacearchaeota archaeon]